MKQKLYLLIVILLSAIAYANMAQPYFSGNKTSTLYGTKNCDVLQEHMLIELISDEYNIFTAYYTISYSIDSEIEQSFPLVFHGINLGQVKEIKTNGITNEFHHSEDSKPHTISYKLPDTILVPKNELIFFDANLKKGVNTIVLKYTATLGSNTYGFIKNQDIEYSFYPSRFWKSFGNVTLKLTADKNIEITSTNIKSYTKNNNTYVWNFPATQYEEIQIKLRPRVSVISKVLLAISPLGLGAMVFLIAMLIHLWFIWKKYQHSKYRFALGSGIFLVPILFYVAYYSSFSLIDYTLGQTSSRHGYIFIIIVTLPILWLVYGLIMLVTDRLIKNRFKVRGKKLS